MSNRKGRWRFSRDCIGQHDVAAARCELAAVERSDARDLRLEWSAWVCVEAKTLRSVAGWVRKATRSHDRAVWDDALRERARSASPTPIGLDRTIATSPSAGGVCQVRPAAAPGRSPVSLGCQLEPA